MTHSFYARMGGLVLECPDYLPVQIFWRELLDLVRDGSIKMPTLTEDEINDRSNEDSAVKLLTVLQSGWFVIQCIVRASFVPGQPELTVVPFWPRLFPHSAG